MGGPPRAQAVYIQGATYDRAAPCNAVVSPYVPLKGRGNFSNQAMRENLLIAAARGYVASATGT